MNVFTIDPQAETFDFGNSLEGFNSFKLKPINTDQLISFSTRNTAFIIENTSTQYMLGDVKPHEIAKYERIGGAWFKITIREGSKIQFVNHTTAVNGVQQLVEYTKYTDVLFIRNTSTRTDHTFTINVRPHYQNQILTIYNNVVDGITSRKVRINFGNPTATTQGTIGYLTATAGTGAVGVEANYSASIGNNKYVELDPARFIILRGMKKPTGNLSTAYFWIVEDSTSLQLN